MIFQTEALTTSQEEVAYRSYEPLKFSFVTRMNHVFVYGTLKRNEPNHQWLLDEDAGYANFIMEAVTYEKYPLIIASKYNIPFLLDKPGEGHHVLGELYEIDYPMLQHLDVLENHPDFYVRELREVKADGKRLLAWIYLIKEFRDDLLQEEFLEMYSSTGAHGKPYVEKKDRDPTYSAQKDIQGLN